MWSGIILFSSKQNFHDPNSTVFSVEKTCLRPAHSNKNIQQWRFLLLCALAKNRNLQFQYPCLDIFVRKLQKYLKQASIRLTLLVTKARRRVLASLCSRQESNLDRQFRKLAFYPLNYESVNIHKISHNHSKNHPCG